MLADLIVVAVLGGLLARSSLGAFRGWLRSKRLPMSAFKRSPWTRVVVLLAVLAGTAWAQAASRLGVSELASWLATGLAPEETAACIKAQRDMAKRAPPHKGPGSQCPSGGGRFTIEGAGISCPAHGKATR